MINLLPHGYKKSLLFARHNTNLRAWLIAAGLVFVGVLLIVSGGFMYLQNQVRQENRALERSQQRLVEQDIAGTRKNLDEISSNTKLILQVLQREVLFSKLLRQLGSSIPANTSLQQIQINELKGGLTLLAGAADINAATQLQLNLQDPKNKIFEKADIENINCDKKEADSSYPCTVQIRALFAKENPYVYITTNQPNGGAER